MPFRFDYPNYVFSDDLIAHDATCAVESAVVRSDGTMDIVLSVYAAGTAFAFAQRQFLNVPYEKSQPDVMAQGEAHLLTLADFSGAVAATDSAE